MDEFKSPRRHKTGTLIVVIGVLAIAVVALGIQLRAKRSQDLELSTVVASETSSIVKGIGTIQPQTSWKVGAEQAGFVSELLVKPGALVEKGAPLLQLRNKTLSEDVRRLVTALKKQQLEQKRLRNVQRATRAEKLQSVREGELAVEAASLKLQATRALAEQGILSEHVLLLAEIEMRKVESELVLHKQSVETADAMAASELELAESELDLAKAELAEVRERTSQLTVVAPIGGRAQWLFEEFGSWVEQGTHVATLAESAHMVADFNVREHEAGLVALGAEVRIIAVGGETMGRVRLVDPAVIDGAVRVRAELGSELPAWARPNSPIKTEILTNHSSEVLSVDAPRGVQPFSDSWVYRIIKDGDDLEAVSVTFGRKLASQLEVRSGLQKGDIIVTSKRPDRNL